MGLAGTSTKVKIGVDPRNTAWSNDTSRFGHKHLEKFGWAPGKGLGTGSSGREALTSHVRVSIKTDNTGLGKKSSKGGNGLDGEISTGLDVFQRLLGKLNGKAQEDIDSQIHNQRQRLIMENSRFGMVFVYGGVLEGSVERKLETHGKRKRNDVVEDESSSEEEQEIEEEESAVPHKRAKKEKTEKSKKREKKDRSKKEKSEKKQKEKEKKEKKEKKSKKSEERSRSKSKSKSKSSSVSRDTSPSPSPATPVLRGRLATRARWIAQKRASVADQKGLNEILMIKA